MAENAGSVIVEVGTDLSKLKRGFDDAVRDSKTSAGKIESAFKSIGGAIAAAGGAFAAFTFLRDSVKESQQAAQALAKVEQAIRTTGGAAGYASEDLQRMASELEKMAGIDGDQILNDVTLQLLTFTNITGDSFKRAQAAVLDLSAVLGSDMLSQTIQLGKALEDPVKGLTALQRVGITFTAQQKDTIKNYVKHNDLISAQGVILKEIETKYGGQAKAMNDASGGVMSLGVAWGNFKEKVGNTILPVISALAGEMQNLTEKTGETNEVWQTLGFTAKFIGGLFGGVLAILQMVGTALGTVGASLYALATGKFQQAGSIIEMGLKKIGNTYTEYDKLVNKIFSTPAEKKQGSSGKPGGAGPLGGAGLTEEEVKKQQDLQAKLASGLNKTSKEYYEEQKKAIAAEAQTFINAGLSKVKAKQWEAEQLKKLNEEVADAELEAQRKAFQDKYVQDRLKASGGIGSVGGYSNLKAQTGGLMVGYDKDRVDNAKQQTGANLKDALKDQKELNEGQKLALDIGQNFASTIVGGFGAAISQGKSLSEVFQNLGKDLAGMVVQAVLFKSIITGLNAIAGGFGAGANFFGAGFSMNTPAVDTGVGNQLNAINNSIQAMNMNMIKKNNNQGITIVMDGKEVTKGVSSVSRSMTKNGVNLNDY